MKIATADRPALTDLISAYGWALDTGDTEALAD